MSGKSRTNEVKLPQTKKERGFYFDDYNKHSNIIVGLRSGSVFRIWLTPKGITWNSFFRFLPPVRFYLNATKGIEKLNALNLDVFDDKGNKVDQKQGSVQRGDVGFDELTRVIKENTSVEDEIHRITLVEDKAGVLIGDSSKIVRLLFLDKGGIDEHLLHDPFDPDKPIRDLRNWVEDRYRRYLANWMMYVVVIWLAANSFMLYLLNK